MQLQRQSMLPWLMWFLPLVFFGFQFILRLFPGLVLTDYLAKYQISAADFGFYASLYYLGYAGMQIPMALLLEKYGPRKIISLSAFLCAFAIGLQHYTDAWYIALLSRFLIGVGSVVGFLGTSKVVSQWFAKERYARLIGLTFSFGLLGALYGGRPVSMMIEKMGWENVFSLLGVFAFILGLFIFIFVRDKKDSHYESLPLFEVLKKLLTHKSLLVLAIANFLMVGSLEGFADVWGIPFLMQARDLSKVQASSITSFVYVGMLFGGPVLAFFAERFKAHYKVTMLSGLLMGALLSFVLLFYQQLNEPALILMMFLIGLLCCYQVIVFAIGAEMVSAPMLSITIAFLNCINMLGGSFFHTVIGQLMDWFEPNSLVNGVKTYSVSTFALSLSIIPLASLLGAFLVWVSQYQAKNVLVHNAQTI